MAINPNLVPTLTVDVNGRTTTVHKKPMTGALNAAIPAPAVREPRPKGRDEIIEGVITALWRLSGPVGDYEAHQIRLVVSDHTTEFITRVVEISEGEDTDLALGVVQHISAGEVEPLINEVIHFHKLSGGTSYWDSSALVRTLGQYSALEMNEDLSKTDDLVQQQCLAIMKAASVIDTESRHDKKDDSHPLEYLPTHYGRNMPIIKDESILELIMEQPESAEEIARIVAEHGDSETDAGFVIGIMQGINPALAEGGL